MRNTMKHRMKKRGELAFSQIVIAVVAIFVLIVLMVIFGGNLGGVNRDLESCVAKGGSCVGDGECKMGIVRPGADLCKNDQGGNICCITVVKKIDEKK